MRISFPVLRPFGRTTKCDNSWVFGRASCLLRHAFSSVSNKWVVKGSLIIGQHQHSSFLHDTGVLLACFTIDYRVLFETLTEEIVQDGFQYYRTFYNAPPGIKARSVFLSLFFFRKLNPPGHVYARRISQALLHGLIGVGLVAIISKIHRWDESAMFFDGGSLGERRSFQCLHHPLSP